MSLFARALLWWLLLSAGLPSVGVAAVAGEQKKQELLLLKEQIKSLQDEIARGEESHDEIADNLSMADKAVSQARRRLYEISAQRMEAENELQRLEARRSDLTLKLDAARKSLGDTVFRIYVEGGQAGARRFLSGDEPNQLARDAYYLELVARYRLRVIEESRSALSDLTGVIAQVEARKAELLLLESEHRKGQDLLLDERKKQHIVLSQVSAQLRAQRKQMQTMIKDEGRIEKLLKGLEKISRQPSVAKRNLDSDPTALVRPKKAGGAVPSGSSGVSPDQGFDGGDFANLKGRLRWPTRGELNGRFGMARAEGGATWKGVFIRAQSGQEVKAVAAGKIAFADWLRGFGNLIIIDHGDGYMTVYGNNESLYKTPGDDVVAGEAIASVGASGGVEESGLYFEIRFRGQAQDPVRWVAAKP